MFETLTDLAIAIALVIAGATLVPFIKPLYDAATWVRKKMNLTVPPTGP